MMHVMSDTADEVWVELADNIFHGFSSEQNSRNFRNEFETTKTLEAIHCTATIKYPQQRLVFSRPINPAFSIAECVWILAGWNDSEFIGFYNSTMNQFSDDYMSMTKRLKPPKAKHHGAYGYRLGPAMYIPDIPELNHYHQAIPAHDQLFAAYNSLYNVPHSRQVVLQIWNHETDQPIDGRPKSKDIPCNIASTLLVRDGKLHWLQLMRSNDLIWGTPYNFVQFTTLQEVIAGWLGIELGNYTHVVNSLHVYQHHWEHLKEIVSAGNSTPRSLPMNEQDLRIYGYNAWLEVFKQVAVAAYEFTQLPYIESSMQVTHVTDRFDRLKDALPEAYFTWVYLLGIDALRIVGLLDEAKKYAISLPEYYRISWEQFIKSLKDVH